jgi:hypothetical protein
MKNCALRRWKHHKSVECHQRTPGFTPGTSFFCYSEPAPGTRALAVCPSRSDPVRLPGSRLANGLGPVAGVCARTSCLGPTPFPTQ